MSNTQVELQHPDNLKRVLSLRNIAIFGMMTMSPLSPFQVYGSVALASYGMVPFVYIIGAILVFFTALSYAKFSREFPIAGSVYSYVGRGLNPHIGFIAGWTMLSDYALAPALMCVFSGLWVQGILHSIDPKFSASVFIIATTLVNIRGIELNAKVNTLLFWMQIVAIALFCGFAIDFVFIKHLGAGGFSLGSIFQAKHISMSFIASSTSMILLGFAGFDGISTLAEETKDPKQTVGKATIIAMVTTALLFFTQSYLASLAHNHYKNLDPNMGMFDIAKEVGGQWFYTGMLIVNIIAVGLAVTLNVQSAVSRVLYAMGRDDLIVGAKYLKRLHPKFKTPVNAILVASLASLALTIFVNLDTIVMLVNFGAVTSYIVLNLSVIAYFFFKKKERGLKGFFVNLLSPLIGLAVCVFVWTGFNHTTMWVGLSWILVGAIIGCLKSNGYKITVPAIEGL